MKIKRLKGTEDILPEEIPAWRRLEEASRRILSLYGYKEIRTPIIEETKLFVRGIGQDTDIVKKQMYSFKDQGGDSICLRPEETASVVRAYVENNMDKTDGFVKLFYIGPMFRGERPQAGRLRQFHQIGVEAIGSYSPCLDAEIIILLDELLKNYGLSEYVFKVNSLGCRKDKERLKDALKEELMPNLKGLCDDCRRRYKTNILRILDCKNEACQKAVRSIKLLEEFLCVDCAKDFKGLQEILNESDVKYEASPYLVRGLDYYTKTVFEVTTKHLGSQNTIAAGGRYDKLVAEFGGAETGACGFAIGIERVIKAIDKVSPSASDDKRSCVFIATLGEQAYKEGFRILNKLRKAGIPADIDYQQKSLKAQMRYADKYKARFVVIIGDDELKKRAATVRNMLDASQQEVPLGGILSYLKDRIEKG